MTHVLRLLARLLMWLLVTSAEGLWLLEATSHKWLLLLFARKCSWGRIFVSRDLPLLRSSDWRRCKGLGPLPRLFGVLQDDQHSVRFADLMSRRSTCISRACTCVSVDGPATGKCCKFVTDANS